MLFRGTWGEVVGTEMIVGRAENGSTSPSDLRINSRSKDDWVDEEEACSAEGYVE